MTPPPVAALHLRKQNFTSDAMARQLVCFEY